MNSIKTKLPAIFLGLFILYGTADYAVQRFIVYPSFLALEHQEAVRDLNRCLQSLRREVYHLDSLCHDWSAWDDTIEFVRSMTPAYIETNLPVETFVTNKLNLICFYNEGGALVWGNMVHPDTGEQITRQDILPDQLPPDHPLVAWESIRKPLTEKSVIGVMMTQRGPLLVASRPIITSKNEGPVRGAVIMCRFLGRELVSALMAQAQVDFDIFPIGLEEFTGEKREVLQLMESGSRHIIRNADKDHLNIYGTFPDIDQKTALLLQATIPRKISRQGDITVRYAVSSIAAAAFFMLMIVLFLTRRILLDPIMKLIQHVQAIGTSGDLSARLNLRRMDEIGILADTFNQMLAKLQTKTMELEKVNQDLVEDVAKRRQAEEELGRAQALLTAAVEQTPAGIIIVDAPNLKLRIANKAAVEILGDLHPDQWEGFHPDGRLMTHDELPLLQAVKEGKIIQNAEIVIKRRDGEERWVLGNAAPVRDESGGIAAGVVVFPDITDRKRAMETLKRSEEKYRLLVENAQDAIFLLQNGHFLFGNPRTLELLGFTAEALSRTSLLELLHPDDAPAVLEHLAKCSRGEGIASPWTFRIVNPSKDVIWVQMNAVLISWEEYKAVLCFARDVTESKRMEKQLLQAQRMESIGTLAGGIAHDFNNILYPIIGYTEVAMRHLPEGDSRPRNYLERVLAAAGRAGELVQQILTFSRRSEHEMKPMLLHPVIKEGMKLLRASIPTTIEIVQDIDTDCRPVLGNPTQIHQIIMNLCTNAYHAMEEAGGRLEVSLKEVELGPEVARELIDTAPGRYARLTVQDSGCGISADIIGKIFDPFFTTKPEGKGTGLGLSLVHGIVKEHGGSLLVESEPGKGTVFTIYFPVFGKEKGLETEGAVLPLPTGTEHVLIVDDEPMIVEMLREMLEDLGYQVSSCNGSAEALEAIRARAGQFDLVISDVTMPYMTGDELAEQIRRIRPGLPVILCTGFSERIAPEKPLKAGAAAMIMKPVRQQTMAHVVRSVLDKST
ncbi:MAG: CHASE4 domain-containing protein [Thermodesulfobacteriota bacterium]